MKKISIIIVTLLCLATLTIPTFASILPINGSTFNAMNGSFSSWNHYASYQNAVNGQEVEADFALKKPVDKGTDDGFNLAYAVAQHTIVNETSCFYYYYQIEIPMDAFLNEYSVDSYEGIIRVRLGTYIRSFLGSGNTLGAQVTYSYEVVSPFGDDEYKSGDFIATYIETPDTVKGRYYFMDASLNVNATSESLLRINVRLTSPTGGYLTFRGGSDADNTSFIKLTSVYVNSVGYSGAQNMPILNGAYVPFDADRTLVLFDGQRVVDYYVNPFDSKRYALDSYSMVLTNETYPDIAYYVQYVGNYSGQKIGYVYTAYIVDNYMLNSFVNTNRPLENYQQGYNAGFTDATDNYQSYVENLEQQLAELRKGMPPDIQSAYNQGVADANVNLTNVYGVLDRASNLVGTITRGIGEFNLFGINLYTIILLVVVCIGLVVILKVAGS